MTERNYAAAVVYFLDRDTKEEKTAYMYPITKIHLITRDAGEQNVLIVDINGNWIVTKGENND